MRELSGISFIRALIPVMRALPSRPNHHGMGLIPNIITLGIKFQQRILESHIQATVDYIELAEGKRAHDGSGGCGRQRTEPSFSRVE